MNISRFFAVTEVVLRGHIFNSFWYGREKRRAIRSDVISDVIPRYFKRYLPAVKKVKDTKVIKNDKNEKIYTMWLQGEDNAPDLVKACFRSMRRHCKQELVILDENNVFDYISLPETIIKKYKQGKIHHAHFADICRVELLYEHGGYWLDATGFVTSPIPKWIEKEDFFVFLAGHVGSPYSFMQNCFIRARKGSYLLAAWRAMILEYWMKENCTFDYFMHQLMFKTLVMNDLKAKKYFKQMPHVDQDPTHELWWKYENDPFDQKKFNKITSGAFFQKTTYQGAKKFVPGSIADTMINKM